MATDPLADLDSILNSLGNPSQPKKRRSRAPSLLPDIAPDQSQGMLSRLASGVMSGLSYVGETLDKPGRAARGLLAGKPGELLNLVPFSDTLGLTDPAESVSGRGLLEKAGVVGRNKAGLDIGDAAGFGAEVLLDPLTLVAGPGKALTKAGEAVARTGVRDAAGKLLKLPGVTPLRRIEEIAAGERGLIGLKANPFGKPVTVLGTGPKAAKAAEWWYYNPATRGFREIFSANPWLKSFDKTLQKAADQEWAIYQDALAGIEETGVALRRKIPELQEIFDNQLKDYLEQNPQLRDAIGGEQFDVTNADDFIRTLAEMKGKTESLSGLLSQTPNTPQNILEAATHFDGVTNEILQLQDELAGQIKSMGGSLGMLDDSFIGHTARRMNPAIIDEARKQFILGGGKANRFKFWGSNKRREILKDIPGGTSTLQRMSRDPRLTANPLPAFDTGKGVLPEALWERARILWDEYGLPQIDRTAKTIDKQTDGLVKFFAELPPVTLQVGLFGPDVATNALDYAIHAARVKGALSATHRLVQDTVSTEEVGPSIEAAFRQLFGTGANEVDDASQWALSHFINEYSKRTGQPLDKIFPSQLYIPEAFVGTAKKYLEYSRPDKVEGFLKFWDQMNSLYKGGLYSPFPASHVRNFISGLWQNMVTAFENPKLAGTAFKETFNVLRGKPSKYADEIKALGIGADGILQEVTGTKAAGGIPSLPTAKGFYAELSNLKEAAKSTARNPKSFFSISNPLNPTNVRGVREGLETSSQFPLFKAGEKAAELVEFVNRATHYIARREAGFAPALAKLNMKAAHFDYAALSDFEKKVLKRFIPFYTFSRKNIASQLKHLMEAPGGRTAQTIRAINDVRDEQQNGGYVPRYLAEGLAIPMGQGVGNTQRFFSSSGLFPVEEAFNRFSFEQGQPNAQRTLEKTASQLHPILGSILEQMTGRELYSGRPLGSEYPFLGDATYGAYKSPAGRVIRLARTWLDDRKSTLEKAVNTIVGGAKVTDVDVEKALAIEAKEQLEKMFKDVKGIRSFERFYAKPADQAEMTPAQLEQLALYQVILGELKRMAEEKKANSAAPSK